MGARESRAQGEEADNAAGPPDYYALLEVDESATADEIKVRRHFLSFCRNYNLSSSIGLRLTTRPRRNRSAGSLSFTIRTRMPTT